jgi:PAS domain S-box-containing protein/diguanylate cyclase (GGDEF)-like protein
MTKELQLYQRLLDNSLDMVFIMRVSDQYLYYVNTTAQNKLGYSLDEFRELKIEEFRKPINLLESFKDHLNSLQIQGEMTDYAIFVRKDKSEFPIEANVKIINIDGIDYNVAIVRDITDRMNYEKEIKELNSELQKLLIKKSSQLEQNMSRLKSYKVAMDESSIVSISDTAGIIKYANDNFCTISGYSKEELVGQPHNIIRHPNTPKEVFEDMWQTIKSKKIWKGRIENRKKNGESYIVDSTIAPILDEKGEIVEYVATRHDITEIVTQKDEIKKLATTSYLTSLGNRNKLHEQISKHKKCSLAIIDIDRFHEINDFYGNAVGDKVIKLFSDELCAILGERYELYHLQGDEFAVLNYSDSHTQFSQTLKDANDALSNTPLTINEKIFYISMTVSISFEPPEKLISTVSLAHTYAKQTKLNFVIFSPDTSLEHEYEDNIKWAVKIKNAIADDRIVVFYQPLVDCTTQKANKFEALVRMVDSDGGIVSPASFLEKAKKSKQYIEITKIVIIKTLKKLSECDYNFSINITMEDILNKDLCDFLFEQLSSCEKCYNITFELVESEGIEKYEQVTRFIKDIKALGCSLAIDDFGTGYSNFEYLLKLNADIIKIDGSLIKQISTNQDYFDIVQTIASFAEIKKLIVVAEFVSTKEIFEKVKEAGIDYAQGYYFSPPRADID